MKIIFLTHHEEFRGYSMTRYTQFLSNGFQQRGHDVKVWAPKNILAKYETPKQLKKWLRYIDTFILFPIWFQKKIKQQPKSTIYVIIDQALGMWVPSLKNKNHVVHCHDFIALKSALGIIPENPTSWSGKKYQNLILKGFSEAKNFLCISKNTEKDLLSFLNKTPKNITQVYNAIDPTFTLGNIDTARETLGHFTTLNLKNGYILHVGGNDFYKNKKGVIHLYEAWRKITTNTLPLLMVGSPPNDTIKNLYKASNFKKDIHFLVKIESKILVQAYQGASLFIFPSLAEGFGWPVAEAMASGCPVITTNAAPMNEVGGTAAIYIERCPSPESILPWANESAKVIENTLQLSKEERKTLIQKGVYQSNIFGEEVILNQIETFYKSITA